MIVSGTYAGPANANFTLDFYKSETASSAQTWIGSIPVTTDASGNATFRAELEPDVPAGWVISATATDANRSTSEFGGQVVVPELPPAAPGEASPPSTQPSGAQSGSSQAPPHKPKPKAKPGKPKLIIEMTASTGFARPSSVIGYTITVRNNGDGSARRVKVCDEPPSGLTILGSEPAAFGHGSTCWKQPGLAAGSKRVFRVTAQIAASVRGAVERNVATVVAANVKGARTDSAKVRMKPLPNTACGSRAFRPSLAARC